MSFTRTRRRGRSASWSPTERAVRIGLALAAVLAGALSATFSLAQVVAKRNPALAYTLAPYDGRITARYAASLSGEDGTRGKRSEIDGFARLAIDQDPTAVLAVATLGIGAELRGDVSTARRLFTYAQHLSRRDIRTQLWMIEDSVRRGQVAGALRQYDLTLSALPQMSGALYPVLASASTDPAIRRELVKLLAGPTSWSDSFIGYVGRQGSDPLATGTLFTDLRRAGVPIPDAAVTGIVDTLISGGNIDEGWTQYAAMRPSARRDRSRDPRFTAGLDVSSRLDWIAISDGGALASIENGAFDFAAPSSIGGPILQQAQVLPPGNYKLIGHSSGIDQPSNSRPYWTIDCQNGHELARVALPNSAQDRGEFSGVFSVPTGCSVQVLVLVVQPSDSMTGLSGRIDRAQIVPVGGQMKGPAW